MQIYSNIIELKLRQMNAVIDAKVTHQEVLDKGYVKLVDWMGSEWAIAGAARTSYKGGKTVNDDIALIDFLIRHNHSSPIEMASVQFEIKLPLDIANQWLRHRTQAMCDTVPLSVNQMSGRYVEMPIEAYIPEEERIKKQSKLNKQCSGAELVPPEVGLQFLANRDSNFNVMHKIYKTNLSNGVAREIARGDLPLCVYTTLVCKMNLLNCLNLMRLRLADDAQWEIRQYAEAVLRVLKVLFPNLMQSWENYILNAKTFSALELEYILENGLKHTETPPSKDFNTKVEQVIKKSTKVTQ